MLLINQSIEPNAEKSFLIPPSRANRLQTGQLTAPTAAAKLNCNPVLTE